MNEQTIVRAASSPPDVAVLAACLFHRVSADDLSTLPAAARLTLAESAGRHLMRRRPGNADVRVFDPPVAELARVTVVEVVNDNMPFLLDSTMAELAERGLEVKLVAHPILALERDPDGRLLGFHGEQVPAASGGLRESLIHIHVPRLEGEEAKASLATTLEQVYSQVRLATGDWQAMRDSVTAAIAAYRRTPPPLPPEEVAEAIAFLEWIVADNFTLMGVREYRFPDEALAADPQDGTGLGILRDPAMRVLRRGGDLVTVTPEVRAFLKEPQALIITKANVKSRVHRRVHMDYIGVKQFDATGRLEGELRIVGIFTATAYNRSTREIPYLRRKVKSVIERAGFDPASHSGKALINVVESYPRDELFQLDVETLNAFASEILSLAERPRLSALVRTDRFDRFVSVLVYIPKDRYDTDVRRRVGAFLARAFDGRVSAAYPAYPDGSLARTHYIIGRDGGATPAIDRQGLLEGIAAIVRTWADDLGLALDASDRAGSARRLLGRYGSAFGAAYQEAFSAEIALRDIATLEGLSAERPRAVDIYRRSDDPETRANLKVFSRAAAMPLSERVPLLEGLGFTVVNERTYRILPADAAEGIWLHDMALERAAGGTIGIRTLEPRLEAVLMALFRGQTESDGYNALIIEAGLAWREVAMLRTLSRYAQQIRVRYSQDYMWSVLKAHAGIAADLVALFHARFDPHAGGDRAVIEAAVSARIDEGLKAVSSLDEDRILRRFRNLIQAAVRTNFFQLGRDGRPREIISFKFEAAKVENLPLPRPLFEIFLSSPRVEGLHLRFGKVARGGIRWSDRPQDFRTEILGLVKAQQVKNAVIVPVGAKGGFVPKRLPPASDRAAWLAEGTEAYKLFITTLLELTDNIDGDGIVPPVDTVRHDPDDPYLVVAADKGTATFSDIANAISEAHGHWLGDAFASGGSVGYDHKKMGITARGAWEAVKRHFREIDVDIQTTPFTVAGVGDMSGDVFGNGMLLSRATKLVAAFDHRDIFVDPSPDPERAFQERERLFALPRSSWQDYDKTLISAGGGVYPRGAKEVPLSDEARRLLGLGDGVPTPQEVMTAILRAEVDLLWFGGIGTYIRASAETDADVGDRANDAIRVAGADLRCKVVGEGANLGATQRGRIEAAMHGVRLNTDAIDNSAGVNTSDIEVNIKIAAAIPLRDGRLTMTERNPLLAAMTDDVAALVLRNNYLQSLALSLSQRKGAADIADLRRLMHALEAEGRLDRSIEFLPGDVELAQREARGSGLTRPELAVLLAYAKLSLHDALVASDVPDDPYLLAELTRYFPAALRGAYPDAIERHRLRREIVATQLANAIINRGGPTLVPRLCDATGRSAADVARAYALARDCFRLLDLNTAIDALDAQVPGQIQIELYGRVQEHAVERMLWFLRHVDLSQGLETLVRRFRVGITEVETGLSGLISAARRARRAEAIAQRAASGVPEALAARIVDIGAMAAVPDAVLVAESAGRTPREAIGTLFALSDHLDAAALRNAAETIKPLDAFERMAIARAVDGIDGALRSLAADVLRTEGPDAAAVEAWSARRASDRDRIRRGIAELVGGTVTQAKLTLAAALLNDLARG